MMNWLREHKNVILMIVIVGFVISTFIGFGLYMTAGAGTVDNVLEVNEEKISYRHFLSLYDRVANNRRDKGEEMTPETLKRIKEEVIQSLVRDSVLYQESKKYGIEVTDMELANHLSSIQAFHKEGKFDPQTYVQTLHYALKTTPEEFEESQKRQIAISRLQYFISQGVKITSKELEQEYLSSKRLPSGIVPPDTMKNFEKEKEQFHQKLLQEKSAHVLNRWYQQLSMNLRVKSNLEEIERRGGR